MCGRVARLLANRTARLTRRRLIGFFSQCDGVIGPISGTGTRLQSGVSDLVGAFPATPLRPVRRSRPSPACAVEGDDVACPRCRQENSTGAHFYMRCGADLTL